MHNIFRDFFYSIFPQEDYLTYRAGKIPVILSAPHGGNMQPISIPKRTWGNRSRDTYTRRLIQLVIERLPQAPYFVFSDIHRNRVDLNRDVHEAAQENKRAEEIWFDWNNILSEFQKDIRNKYTRALYIDIHSHNNSNEFQIGYGLKVKDYISVLSHLDAKEKSTMQVFEKNGSMYPALFGEYSFPQSIRNYGFRVLVPKDDRKYLNGGRNIKQYSQATVGAIQIECPIPILRTNLNEVANCLVYGINRFRENFLD